MLGLRCCARASSTWGYSFVVVVAVRGPLSEVAPLAAEHGLQARRPQPLWLAGSRAQAQAAVAHGLSRSAACGILPDQGSNPRPLHRQVDSQPPRHQGSPCSKFLNGFYHLVLKLSGCNSFNSLQPWSRCHQHSDCHGVEIPVLALAYRVGDHTWGGCWLSPRRTRTGAVRASQGGEPERHSLGRTFWTNVWHTVFRRWNSYLPWILESFGNEKTLNKKELWFLSLKIHEVAIMFHFFRHLIKHL